MGERRLGEEKERGEAPGAEQGEARRVGRQKEGRGGEGVEGEIRPHLPRWAKAVTSGCRWPGSSPVNRGSWAPLLWGWATCKPPVGLSSQADARGPRGLYYQVSLATPTPCL